MTKLEHMAEEFSKYLADDVQLREHRDMVEAAYIVGFKAAREMLAKRATVNVGCDSCNRHYSVNFASLVEQLGEDEAE